MEQFISSAQQLVSYTQAILDILIKNDRATILFIGFLLLALGCYATYRAVGAQNVTSIQKFAAYGGGGVGLTLILSALVYGFLVENNLLNAKIRSPNIIGANAASPKAQDVDELINNLKTNKKITWLIRLIGRKDKNDALAVGKFERLGQENKKYTFVADYDELKGMTASAAAKAVGLNAEQSFAMSAVIFPLGRNKIFPASARGLLQVISQVEDDASLQLAPKYNVKSHLMSREASDFDKQKFPVNWAWDSYKQHYRKYCNVALDILCSTQQLPAVTYIGDVSDDWHPLGFAKRQVAGQSICEQTEEVCGITDWEKAKAEIQSSFGVRVFLIENLKINEIYGRILIDFNNPSDQIIPYISQIAAR